jgi:ABC-2 type transport system permease protein
MMMTVIQNSFANTSSSLIGSKVQGNIVDTLMPPLSAAELVAGYVAGGIGRGALVGLVLLVAMVLGLGMGVAHPLWAMVFVVLGAGVLGGLGIIAAIYARKFDQMAAITNFVVTPLSFLSGTFYSLEAMPPLMQTLSHVNPMFYMIDGVRYGVLGVSDSSPWLALAVCGVTLGGILVICWALFRTGYRLKP